MRLFNASSSASYRCLLLCSFIGINVCAIAQVIYPCPLHSLPVIQEGIPAKMVYMDVQAAHPNGKTIILFHGKNFSGYYWKDLLPLLSAKGYRVLVPDLPGWGRSSKPNWHYSFYILAEVNKQLLDTLGIRSVIVLGHSMGGMLAVRFTLLFPSMVEKLVLENPIGLEDYQAFVPYQPLEKLYRKEKSATYESYKKYQQGYFPEWKPGYDQYVAAQAEALADPSFDSIARVNAITYQMIYEQPVIHDLGRIKVPTLFIIGQWDRTIVGKEYLDDSTKAKYGQYPQLGRAAAKAVAGSKLIELPGIGHICHVQDLSKFAAVLFTFL